MKTVEELPHCSKANADRRKRIRRSGEVCHSGSVKGGDSLFNSRVREVNESMNAADFCRVFLSVEKVVE
jgi:hypothetical protein